MKIKQLTDLGIIVDDIELANKYLRSISFDRVLEAIKIQRYIQDDKEIYFYELIELIDIDRELRMELFNCIEIIELSLKANIASLIERKYPSDDYLKITKWTTQNRDGKRYEKIFRNKINDRLLDKYNALDITPLTDDFEIRIDRKYGNIWDVFELITFREIYNLYTYMTRFDQDIIAKEYDMNGLELKSQIDYISYIRNICAHNKTILDINMNRRPVIKGIKGLVIEPYKSLTAILLIVDLAKDIREELDINKIIEILDKLLINNKTTHKYGGIDKEKIMIYLKEKA